MWNDISHTDQLTFIIRFIRRCEPLCNVSWCSPPSFLMEQRIYQTLLWISLTIKLSRWLIVWQCLKYVWTLFWIAINQSINQLNEFAIYVPSAGHCLNSVWAKAAGCCLKTVKFFHCSESVFLFLCLYTSMECSSIIFRKKYLWSSVYLTRDGHHILMLFVLYVEISRKLNMHWILYQLTLNRKWI